MHRQADGHMRQVLLGQLGGVNLKMRCVSTIYSRQCTVAVTQCKLTNKLIVHRLIDVLRD